jgi:predicted dehydrogenase
MTIGKGSASNGKGSASNGNGTPELRSVRTRQRQLGVLVIGCGHWGRHYVRVFRDLPDTRVVAVCDPSLEQLESVAAKFPDVILTQRLEDALQLPGIDCAVVATQASTHFEVASECLEADKPVLVEKPLTTTSADADALVELAESRGLTLMVGHTFVYNAAVRKMREYLLSGALGDIYYLYARRTSLGPIRTDVNALWDLASHDVSIFNYLLGTGPDWVSAVGARVLRNEREDVGFVSIGYPGGVVAHVHVSWADPNKTRELVVVGSEKQVVFDDLNTRERVRVFSKGVRVVAPVNPSYGEFMFQLRDGDIVSPLIEASEPLQNECAHFIRCLQTGDKPLTDGIQGLRAVRVMEAIDRSIARGGVPASLSEEREVGRNGRAPAYAVR